jgi:UDP-hydrolysing UDP-N-acetyl-D-glucosamine 2-epimerase
LSQQRKICVVITNRANYARIKTVLRAIQQHPRLELQLIACSSAVLAQYGDVSALIERDGFEIHERLFTALEGTSPLTMTKGTGLALIEIASCYDRLKPDAVLVVADRYEILAAATAAAYMNIPLAHTQGGEVSGSIDDRVRHAVTKLADLHFPATQLSYDRLVKMGENPAFIWLVGCPAMDLIAENSLDASTVDLDRYGGIGAPIDPTQPFLLVMQHPVTTEFRHGLTQIEETLFALNEFAMPSLLLFPNIDAGSDDITRGIRRFREHHAPEWLYLMRNVLPEDYARLLNAASVIIGNSSSGIREASFLGVPAVNIGTRQQGRERHLNVLDVDYDREAIAAAIQTQLHTGRYAPSTLFGKGDAGACIADVLATADLDAIRQQKRLFE